MSFDFVNVAGVDGGMTITQAGIDSGSGVETISYMNFANDLPAQGGAPLVAYNRDKTLFSLAVGGNGVESSLSLVNQGRPAPLAAPTAGFETVIGSVSAPLFIRPPTGGLVGGVLTDISGDGECQWLPGGGGGGGIPPVGPLFAVDVSSGSGAWLDSGVRIDSNQTMTNIAAIQGKTGAGLEIAVAGVDPLRLRTPTSIEIAGTASSWRMTTAAPTAAGQVLQSTGAGSGASTIWATGGGGGDPSVGPLYALNVADSAGGWLDSGAEIDASQNLSGLASITMKPGGGFLIAPGPGNLVVAASTSALSLSAAAASQFVCDADLDLGSSFGALKLNSAAQIAVGTTLSPANWTMETASPAAAGEVLQSTASGSGAPTAWVRALRSQGVAGSIQVSTSTGGLDDSGILVDAGQLMRNVTLVQGGTGGLFLQSAASTPLSLATAGGGNGDFAADLSLTLSANGPASLQSNGDNVSLACGDASAIYLGAASTPNAWALTPASPSAPGQVLTATASGPGATTAWLTPSSVVPIMSSTSFSTSQVIPAAALLGGIIRNTAATPTSWTLPTGVNFQAASGDTTVGQTHICYIFDTGGGPLTILGSPGMNVLSGAIPQAQFLIVINYLGAQNYTVFV